MEDKKTHSELSVSIIIPAYNYENFIVRAIESALGQDHPEIEVIVVDDGSTDSTGMLAARFEPKVRLVSQRNQGLAGARNEGIARSKGAFIIFLDADDWMESFAVSQMVKKFAELPAEYGVVACEKNVIDRTGKVIVAGVADKKGEDVEVVWEDLVLSRPHKRFLPFALIKREVFERSGLFDVSYGRLGSEDREFFIRVSRSYRICRMNARLLNYTIHGLNMSADPNRQLPGMLKCLRAVKDSDVRPWRNILFWSKVHAFFHYQASGMYRDLPDHTKALKHIVASILRYPFPLSRKTYSLPHGTRLRRLWVCGRDCLLGLSNAGSV
ncbi:glycosyltransferase [Phragmitibacter flavus]|uniref:Glycosyltransferase n=1 Tax=Phragmitibacter flavus TaxID=2576071 RepID=A0A5R8KAG9_9BACT|nr:glycosyltransferase [Phragmitibacter flavus]TLD69267.1 glycosyltransferase [Phragmitibacter flavus]